MKKISCFLVAILVLAVSVGAQTKTQRFGSKDLNTAIETWKYVADNNKKDQADWAKAVYQEFGLNDEGAIRHAFVVNARDSFDVATVMGLTKMWINKAFTYQGDTIVEYDVNKRIIRAQFKLVGMADAYGFQGLGATASEAHVTIPLDITFQFKDNRLRYDARISNFILDSSDWVKDVVGKVTPVADCYPVKANGKHRDSYSRAFINGNAKCLTACRDYINYLNSHFGEQPKPVEKKKVEEDW